MNSKKQKFEIWPRTRITGVRMKKETCEMRVSCMRNAIYIAVKEDETAALYCCKKHALPYMDDSAKKKRQTVYMTKEASDSLDSRSLSVFVNQMAPRLVEAAKGMTVTKADIDFYKRHFKKKQSPKYENQGALIQSFAELTGRTLCEAVIVLDRVERENYME